MKPLSQCITFRKENSGKLDEKTIFFTVERCILDQYGKQGNVNIKPVSWKKGVLVMCIAKPIWRTEFLHQKESFIACCNEQFLPQKPIDRVVVRDWV